jgi:hypothetical protein
MLVSEGKTALKRFGFDDNDPLLTWLNESMHQFEDAREWGFLQQTTTLSAIAGASTLTLPSALYKIHSIRDVSGKTKLQYMTVSEFERDIEDPTQAGAPEFYTITGTETVQLYPILDTGRNFRVVYQEEFVDMSSDAAQMPGPTRIHYPIVQGAAMIGLQAENEEDRAVVAKNEFEAAIDRIWGRYSRKELDEPQQVTDVMNYGCG